MRMLGEIKRDKFKVNRAAGYQQREMNIRVRVYRAHDRLDRSAPRGTYLANACTRATKSTLGRCGQSTAQLTPTKAVQQALKKLTAQLTARKSKPKRTKRRAPTRRKRR